MEFYSIRNILFLALQPPLGVDYEGYSTPRLTFYILVQSTAFNNGSVTLMFGVEDGKCTFLRKVGNLPAICRAVHVVSGPGSVVGIATGYGLGGPWIESRWGRDFT